MLRAYSKDVGNVSPPARDLRSVGPKAFQGRSHFDAANLPMLHTTSAFAGSWLMQHQVAFDTYVTERGPFNPRPRLTQSFLVPRLGRLGDFRDLWLGLRRRLTLQWPEERHSVTRRSR